MTQIYKKTLAMMMAGIMLASSSVNVSAQKIPEEENQLVCTSDGTEMYLIREEQTVEGDCVITTRLYSDVNPMLRATSGSGTYKSEKEHKFNNYTMTYWVQGYFTWDSENGTSKVSNVSSGHTDVGGVTVSDESTTSASNQGSNILWGHKYAYAKYTFKTTNWAGGTLNFSAYIEVDTQGTVRE